MRTTGRAKWARYLLAAATVLSMSGASFIGVAHAAPATGGHTARPPAHRLVLPAVHAPRRAGTASNGAVTPQPNSVTGQGRADAIVRDPGPDVGTLRIYPNNGSTTSNPWTTAFLAAGSGWGFANALLLADVTGDGRPDVIARDPSVDNGTLWIYPNNGSTTSNPWTTRFSAGTGWNTVGTLMIGDVTGDGHPDIIATDPAVDNGTLWIYPNNGSTTSNPWTLARIWAGTGWNTVNSLMIGDVTGDGHPDIVARDPSGALWVYPNNGSTTSDPWTSRFAAGTGWNLANTMMLGDVTGDGRPDIIARDATGTLWVYPHNGSTTSNPWTLPRYSAGTGWDLADQLLLGDLSGTGHPDVIARIGNGGNLWVYPNNGAVSSPWISRFTAGTGWAFENTLLAGDVNHDGRPDLVARDPSVDNGTLWIYPNSGAATGNPWTLPRYSGGTGWNAVNTLMLGDITGDGYADIVARDTSGNLWVYPNSGTGTSGNAWTGARTWAGSGWNTAAWLRLADVNHDGVADLIDLEQDGTMWIYISGSAGPPIQVAGDWHNTTALALGDVYGTGRSDLVTRDSSGALWIYANNGSTTGDPWTSRTTAGADWSFASEILAS
jgi:hypothetical protein